MRNVGHATAVLCRRALSQTHRLKPWHHRFRTVNEVPRASHIGNGTLSTGCKTEHNPYGMAWPAQHSPDCPSLMLSHELAPLDCPLRRKNHCMLTSVTLCRCASGPKSTGGGSFMAADAAVAASPRACSATKAEEQNGAHRII